MSEEPILVATIRAALVQVDANIEALTACRDRLTDALTFSLGAAHRGGGDAMVSQPGVIHPVASTINSAVAAMQRPKPAPAKAAVKKKTAPTPSRPPTGKHKGQGKTDYVAIAVDIIALRAAGKPVAAALAVKYRVPESTTKNWVGKCRQLGLLPADRPTGLRIVEDNTRPDSDAIAFDAALVAETYLGAVRLGKRPVQTIADRFNIDHSSAQAYVAKARQDGALPPANEPQLLDDERRAILDEYKPEPVA